MLAKALACINASGEDGTHYEIVLEEDEMDNTAAGYTIGTGPSNSSTGNRTNLTVTLRGTDNTMVTVTKDAVGPLLTVYGGIMEDSPHLILENITLQGYSGNDSALVVVGGMANGKTGYLTMKVGSRVTGNTNTVSLHGSGGGIFVATAGTFYMQDGLIDTNHVKNVLAEGGGVCSFGTFEMSGGSIKNNTAEAIQGYNSYGGGVYAKNFAMSGGSIENNRCLTTGISYGGGVEAINFTMDGDARIANNSAERGGGVFVNIHSTFTMLGGTINSNTAAAFGAGICVMTDATFAKVGGIIYGIDEGVNSNKAAVGIADMIHAIELTRPGYYASELITKYYRDTAAGEEVDLSSDSDAGWKE
jgi:hypothetical protein